MTSGEDPERTRLISLLEERRRVVPERETGDRGCARPGRKVDDPMLLESRGSVLEGQGQPEEALATWRRVFDLDPDSGVGRAGIEPATLGLKDGRRGLVASRPNRTKTCKSPFQGTP